MPLPQDAPPPAILPIEIKVEDLRRSFGEHEVLRGINLDIHCGEISAIVGASGSGKTVLLDHIIGLLAPTSGRILAADHDRTDNPLVDLATADVEQLDGIRLHWAVVFQKNALFSGTVLDNIALWLREHTQRSEEDIRRIVIDSLCAVNLDPDDVLKKDRDALSGGMAKRVAVARAIAIDPIDLFYDEPTTGLDPVVAGHIHELIWNTHRREVKSIAGVPRTTVIVTHDRDLLRRLRPRVIMLDAGAVCFDGSYDQFEVSEVPAARQYLQAMPVLHARAID